MVQLMKSRSLRPDLESTPCGNKVPVKLEIEDPLEEEYGPLSKRSKTISTLEEHWSNRSNGFPVHPSQCNPLDEPSPLGLQLRKSPSLLDLIQMKLSQSNMSTAAVPQRENLSSGVKKESRVAAASGNTDKLKALNFPASLLRIGCWEYKSRYEGDLVVKCYFGKHKLVWEVLEGGLKSKIETQWSDITALSANCPDNGPGTLTVVLARQPLFFRETNPQPRKHTLWQATSDFTDGQASMHRQHFLQCPQELLSKHFEKLIQCDMRLNFLSQQPKIVLDSPYFESQPSIFEDLGECRDHDLGQVMNSKGSTTSGMLNVESPSATQSSSLTIEHHDPIGMTLESQSREAPSPSSEVMDTCAIDGSGSSEFVDSKMPRNWEQIKLPGIHPSMSMSDFMSQIGHCISEQMTSGNPSFSAGRPQCQDILEDIAQYLLSDNQLTTTSDEKSLMSRVNSLYCLLQKDQTTIQNSQISGENTVGPDDGNDVQVNHTLDSMHSKRRHDLKAPEEDIKDVSRGKQVPGMSRKDSFGELLLHLPRIASLPKFLFNISEEDGDSQPR